MSKGVNRCQSWRMNFSESADSGARGRACLPVGRYARTQRPSDDCSAGSESAGSRLGRKLGPKYKYNTALDPVGQFAN